MANSQKISGIITSLNSIPNTIVKKGGGTFGPSILYPTARFWVKNKQYLIRGSILAGYINYHPYYIGEKITLLYKKNDPDKAFINNIFELWIIPFFILCFGIIFYFLIPFLMRLIIKQIQQE